MQRKKILVIDDEPAVHRLLEIILEGEDIHVVGLDESGGTKQSISGSKPDLIILDIIMPEVDGFEVLRMLKADEETRDIPVIILSARNQREYKDKAKMLGADIYMTKPFQPAQLLKAIRSLSLSQSIGPL